MTKSPPLASRSSEMVLAGLLLLAFFLLLAVPPGFCHGSCASSLGLSTSQHVSLPVHRF